MKGSWWAGIIMLYVGLLVLSLIAERSATPNSDTMNVFDQLMTLNLTSYNNPVEAATSFATHAGDYFKIAMQIIFLWFPDIWVGNWVWFYWIVCFPVTIMMIASIIMVLRGVPSF